MLRRIELVKESQPLQQQLGVIGERVTAERDDILCQTARDHQRGRTAQFFLDTLRDAVQQDSRPQHRAGEHTLLGIDADRAFGRRKMYLRQLGAPLPQRPQTGGKSGADDAAPEDLILIYHVERGGGAEVYRDHRQGEVRRRVGRIHKAVLADGVRVRHPHREAGADVGRDDDRLFAGVVVGALGQRPRDLGDDAGEDSALEADGLFRLSPMGEHLFHLGTVLRRCAGAHRVHVGHKAYTSVPDAPEGDGGVAYVNG